MTDKILMSKMLKDPNFLGSHDLVKSVTATGQPVYSELTLTIKSIDLEEITDMEKLKDKTRKFTDPITKKAYIMHFEENYKPYVVKAATVITNIERATGTKVVNFWIGKKITFYVECGVYMPGTKKADNITTDALRVRPYPPAPEKPAPKCEECGCDITAVSKMTAEAIAIYTEKKYGVKLCGKCATRRAAEEAEKEKTENE